MKNKILITGGLGFIYSHVTEYFVAKGWDVVVIDDQSIGSHPEIISDKFKYYNIDCSEREVQDVIIEEDPHYIIHAAAISDVDQSITDPEYVLRRNILASINVFEAARFCKNLKKFMYVSTDEVYGECEYPKTESDIIFPKNPYSVSKAVGSLIRLGYGNTYESLKLKTMETRLCNVFGPRQDNRKILPLIKESLQNGKVIPFHNDGKGYREFIYVKNVPPLIELLLEKGYRTYNVTTGEGCTISDLIKKCEDITGKKVHTTNAIRPGMDTIYQMDSSRIKEELGWTPLYNFEEGLREYLNG